MLRTIKAKFPTTCAGCGQDIDKGDKVRWNGNGKVYCLTHRDHKPSKSGYPSHVIMIGSDGGVNVYRPDWSVFSDIATMLDQDALVSTAPAFNVESLPVESVEVTDVVEKTQMPTIWETDNPEPGKEYLITPPPEPADDPMAAMFAKLQALDA